MLYLKSFDVLKQVHICPIQHMHVLTTSMETCFDLVVLKLGTDPLPNVIESSAPT